MRLRRIPVVFALVLPLVVLGATDASATFPGKNGKIAVSSNRNGNFEIYTINQDGSGATNITNNSATDQLAAWSPDGSRIAFQSYRDGNFEIYVMNEDGSGQTRLTTSSGTDVTPAWSADGTKIAFSSNRDGNNEIYVMNADGSSPTRLTTSPGIDTTPHWSPDGSKIAFSSNRDGNFEVYSMGTDGSAQTNLSQNSANDFASSWHPNGSALAFTSNRDGNFNVYTMKADGSEQTQMTDSTAADTDPAYSADGSEIVFDSDRSGNLDLWRIEVGTTAAAGGGTKAPAGVPTAQQVTTDPNTDSGGGECQQAGADPGVVLGLEFFAKREAAKREERFVHDAVMRFLAGANPQRNEVRSGASQVIAWEIDGKSPLGKKSGRVPADPDGETVVKLKIKRSYKPGNYTATGTLIEISESGAETVLARASDSMKLKAKHIPG